MGKFLYLMSFLASLDPTYRDAGETSRRALLETPELREDLKHFQDVAEKELYKKTGLKQDDVIYLFYLYPILAGKLSTKPMKGLKYEIKDGFIIRPEVEYTFKDKQYTSLLILVKEF